MAAGGATGRTRLWRRPEVLVAARDAAATLTGLATVAFGVFGGEPALCAVGAGALGLPMVLRCDDAVREGEEAVRMHEQFAEYRDALGR